MILPPIVERVLYAGVVFALILTALTSTRRFLFLLGFVIPLMTPRIDLGVGLDWYKIVGPIAIGLSVLNRRGGVGLRRSKASWAWTFIAYVVVVSTVWMFFEYTYLERYRLAAAMELGGGIAQNRLKMPVQLGSVLGQILAIFAVPLWARTKDEARAAVNGVVVGVGLSASLGVLAWLTTGVGTINTPSTLGVMAYTDYNVTRIGGLSGEPKLLGMSLALPLVYFLGRQVFGEGTRRVALTTGVLGLGLFATFSTSGWIAVAGGLVTLLILVLLRPSGARFSVLAVMLGVILTVGTSVGFVGQMVESRIVDRLSGDSSDLDQQKDIYVFRALKDEPQNAVFGYGLGGGDFAVIPYIEWIHLKYRRTPTPGVTGVRILGDLGIMGLLLMAWTAFRWGRHLHLMGDRPGSVFAIVGLVTVMLGSLIGVTIYFFLMGALLSVAALDKHGQDELAFGVHT